MSDELALEPPPGSFEVKRAAHQEIGQIWASIFFAPEAKTPKTLLVTSAERQEGATQIAAALAILGAQSNAELRVLLVDFNLHQPRLADVLDIQPTIGLAEVIRGEAKLDQAICDTGLPNLGLLPAGQQVDRPLGLLRSERLRTIMEELRQNEQVDHVIIDTAAANGHPEAQTLAGLVDGVLLVTRAGVTRRESVAEAKKRIEQNQGRLLGVVLNQRRFPIPGFLYRRL